MSDASPSERRSIRLQLLQVHTSVFKLITNTQLEYNTGKKGAASHSVQRKVWLLTPKFSHPFIMHLLLWCECCNCAHELRRELVGLSKEYLGHFQCRLYHGLYGHLLLFYLLYFADVAVYLSKGGEKKKNFFWNFLYQTLIILMSQIAQHDFSLVNNRLFCWTF